MQYRISNPSFPNSLIKLTRQEQTIVKNKAFGLFMYPNTFSKDSHRLERIEEKNFWSVEVNKDLRLIAHKIHDNILLCYVDHHDDAYIWAKRRKIETHPKTGAAQLVEIRELVKDVATFKYITSGIPAISNPPLFANVFIETLLSYGVPPEWINDVHNATEDTIESLAEHLPGEAANILLDLATGKPPQVPQIYMGNPFEHPDAQRRFRLINNKEEFKNELKGPNWRQPFEWLVGKARGILEAIKGVSRRA